MNIAEILKDAPRGTKLYSTIYGEVELLKINNESEYPIRVKVCNADILDSFNEKGKHNNSCPNGECVLFPSKENRDWNTFKVEKSYDFKPFDKVLVRDTEVGNWCCDYFSHKNADKYYCVGAVCNYCIPYNDDTKHLVGTNKTL